MSPVPPAPAEHYGKQLSALQTARNLLASANGSTNDALLGVYLTRSRKCCSLKTGAACLELVKALHAIPSCRLTTPTEGHSRYQPGRWYDLAGLRGHTEVLLFVLSRGEPPANLATACHYAAAAGRVHTLRALLQAGVPLLRTSALRDAVDQQRMDIVAAALPFLPEVVAAEESCYLVRRACDLPADARLAMVNAVLAASWPQLTTEHRCKALQAALQWLRDEGELRVVWEWVLQQPEGPDCCLVAAVEARDKAGALGLLEGGAASPAACNARALLEAVRTGQLRVVRTMMRLCGPQHVHTQDWGPERVSGAGEGQPGLPQGAELPQQLQVGGPGGTSSKRRALSGLWARAGQYLLQCAGPGAHVRPTQEEEEERQERAPAQAQARAQPQLLQECPSTDQCHHDGGTCAQRLTCAQVTQALVCALRDGCATKEVVACLLEGGPDLAHWADGRTLLALAMAADLRDDPSGLGRVRLLLGRGVEPQDGFTLRVAAEAGCVAALQLLLDAGARVHGAQGLGLVYAAARSRDRRVAGFLLQRLQGVGRGAVPGAVQGVGQGVGQELDVRPYAALLLRAALAGVHPLRSELRLLGLWREEALPAEPQGERAFCAAVGRELGTALLRLAGR